MSHYGGTQFASNHFDSNHYGGLGVIIVPVAKGGVEDAFVLSRNRRREEQDFISLLVAVVQVIERDRTE